jgi:prolipoprotein diacylglyceryltransferase
MHPCTVTALQVGPAASATPPRSLNSPRSGHRRADSALVPEHGEPGPTSSTTVEPPSTTTTARHSTGTLAVTLWYVAHGPLDDGGALADEGCVIHVHGERDVGNDATQKSRFDRLLRLESVADHDAACVSVLVEDLPLGSWRVTASRCSDHDHDAPSPATASLPSSGWVASTSLPGPDAYASSAGEGAAAAAPGVTALTATYRETVRRVAPHWHLPGVQGPASLVVLLLGAWMAVWMTSQVAAQRGLPAAEIAALSVSGLGIGVLTAMAVAAVHQRLLRQRRRLFPHPVLVVTAAAVLAGGAAWSGLVARTVLDAATPGLLLGLAAGHVSHTLSGRGAGRPSTSRWALWATDRYLATRRVPVQLYQAAWTVTLALLSLAGNSLAPAAHIADLHLEGALFTVSAVLYLAARLLWRATKARPAEQEEPRRSPTVAMLLALPLAVAVILPEH